MSTPDKSVTLHNESYVLDENSTPMWYVFTTVIELDDMIEAVTVVIGPSTESPQEVIDYMNNEVAGTDRPVLYRGGFDHEPTEEELSQFEPEGYEPINLND